MSRHPSRSCQCASLTQRHTMVDPTIPFQYIPLLGPKNIRVLILHPARRSNQPIECSFRKITLQDNVASVDYEALSYTWGAPRGTEPIQCEGRTILVTLNCEQALLHLRQRFKPRTLWIDAICINQQSTEEKNQQVSMMGDIYTSATRTILWLGPKTNADLDAIMRHAARYGNMYQGVRKAYRKIRPDNSLYYTESVFEAPILCEHSILMPKLGLANKTKPLLRLNVSPESSQTHGFSGYGPSKSSFCPGQPCS